MSLLLWRSIDAPDTARRPTDMAASTFGCYLQRWLRTVTTDISIAFVRVVQRLDDAIQFRLRHRAMRLIIRHKTSPEQRAINCEIHRHRTSLSPGRATAPGAKK